MFKSKSTLFGVAVALVASSLLLAGMAVSTTSGAGTDFPGKVSGGPASLPTDGGSGPGVEPGANPGGPNPVTNPPAAPIEPPANTGGLPGTNPAGAPAGTNTGGAGAGGAAPIGLPNAGLAGTEGSSTASMIVLFGLAGAALAGAGVTFATAARRED